MSEIHQFPKEKVSHYPKEAEMFERLAKLVHEYDGEISVVSAIGVIEMLKLAIIQDSQE